MGKFSCITCQRSFKWTSGLDFHCCTKLHVGLWECCGATFYCRAHCEKHIVHDSWHTMTTSTTCDACKMTFPNVTRFEKHRKAVHAKPSACPFCVNSPSNYGHDPCDNSLCGLRSDQASSGATMNVDTPTQPEVRHAATTVEPGPPLSAREQMSTPVIEAPRAIQYCDVPIWQRRRYCPSCKTVSPSLASFRTHQADQHGIITLVSPEVVKIQKSVANQKKLSKMTEDEQAAQKAAEMQRKRQKKVERAEKRRREMEERKKEMESLDPVACVVCSKKFATPGDYAQHLESGTHRNIKRHHVTQAVHMLDVVPPITLAPSIQYASSVESEGYTTSTITPFSSIPSSPIGEASVPGSPLQDSGSSQAGSVVLASSSSLSSEMFFLGDARAFPTVSPFGPTLTYTADDFVNLGIPYACVLCSKTFRTVVQLTSHMNSPVHDPDAFKCPGPKCGQNFALVSGLIRHLESGRCNLASAGEIFERFALLTTKFSKYLTA